jgi:hypothetical protein
MHIQFGVEIWMKLWLFSTQPNSVWIVYLQWGYGTIEHYCDACCSDASVKELHMVFAWTQHVQASATTANLKAIFPTPSPCMRYTTTRVKSAATKREQDPTAIQNK